MHPIIYLAIEIALTVFVVGFIPPSSALRWAGFLAIILCVVRCIPECMPYMVRTPWAAFIGGYSVTYLYHYLDVALLSCWSFEHGGPVGGLLRPTPAPANAAKDYRPRELDSMRERLLFGIRLTYSFRFVGTRYEVRNTPPAVIAQRREFLRRVFINILVSYAILDFISSSNNPDISSRFFVKEKIPILARWHEVTVEELTIRYFTVLATGVSMSCFQRGIYNICALLAISTGTSDPPEWPPFYGPAREAYKLRRFWEYVIIFRLLWLCTDSIRSIFWHQTNSRKFSSIAHYTTHEFLGLPRGTRFAGYIRILIAFTSSGIMHLLIDLASGISFRDSGAMRFFLAQAFGMVLEDCAVEVHHVLLPRARLPSFVAKIIGFMWVSVFLAWSVPAYIYPMLWRVNMGYNDSTIPYSFFGPEAQPVMATGCLLTAGIIAFVG